jgi:thiosulfate/3-mercaptopyruvate sulfurtransferase
MLTTSRLPMTPRPLRGSRLAARCCLVGVCVLFVCQITRAADAPVNTGSKGYPRGDRLADPADLVKPASQAGRVILDARDKEKYLEAHVPDAVWIDIAEWSKAATQDSDATNWTRRFADVGIDPESEVIVYDDQRLRSAARAWWILRLWGVNKVRVLNGGWDAWRAADYPVRSGNVAVNQPGSIVARLQDKVLATKDQVRQSLADSDPARESVVLQLVDTRSSGEFCGTEPSRAKRAGTIPGARHLEWSDLLVANSSRLKSADELRSLFEKAGIDPLRPSATFCQGGGRASVTAFVLEVMGSPESRNYYRGWGEWGSADDTPVVAGQE